MFYGKWAAMGVAPSPAVALAAAAGMADCLGAGIARLAASGAFSHIYLANTAALESLPLVVAMTAPSDRALIPTLLQLSNQGMSTKAAAALGSAAMPAGVAAPVLRMLDMNAATKIPPKVPLPGVSDFQNACLVIKGDILVPSPDVVSLCPNPNTFTFYDSLHPTTEAHRLVSCDSACTHACMARRAL